MTYRDIDVLKIIEIARAAGAEVMKIYARDFEIEWKTDHSPLTEADKVSNRVIVETLQKHYPNIPYISEETKLTPYETRKHWKRLWFIDPIDGTKEFIKKNGEFTINIALVEDGTSVLGVVFAPALNRCYVGIKGQGSFLCASDNSFQVLKPGKDYKTLSTLNIVASRSHLNEATLAFVEALKASGTTVHFVSSGSSLKFCLVAEGAADVYPRFAPTMEWDTAAAHAVALYAGKPVLDTQKGTSLVYNKENLLNPWFVVG